MVPILGALFLQVSGQLSQRLGAVGRAAGVIGRVDEYGGGVLVHQAVQHVKVDLEILAAGRGHAQGQACTLHIGLILREERRKSDDVLPQHSNAAHRMGQRAGCAGGHKDMVAGVVHAKAAVQAFGHLGAHVGQGQRGRVAVQRNRVHMLQQIQADIGKFLRCGHRGVTERIIEHILVSDLGTTGGAPLRDLADDRFCPQHVFIMLCDHNTNTPLRKSVLPANPVFFDFYCKITFSKSCMVAARYSAPACCNSS